MNRRNAVASLIGLLACPFSGCFKKTEKTCKAEDRPFSKERFWNPNNLEDCLKRLGGHKEVSKYFSSIKVVDRDWVCENLPSLYIPENYRESLSLFDMMSMLLENAKLNNYKRYDIKLFTQNGRLFPVMCCEL